MFLYILYLRWGGALPFNSLQNWLAGRLGESALLNVFILPRAVILHSLKLCPICKNRKSFHIGHRLLSSSTLSLLHLHFITPQGRSSSISGILQLGSSLRGRQRFGLALSSQMWVLEIVFILIIPIAAVAGIVENGGVIVPSALLLSLNLRQVLPLHCLDLHRLLFF